MHKLAKFVIPIRTKIMYYHQLYLSLHVSWRNFYTMIRKNISLYEEDMKKIQGIVEKYEGNLSAAMREIIEFAYFMERRFGSLEEAKKIEKRIKGVCIPNMLLNWFLMYTEACLPDEKVLKSLEDIHAITRVSDLETIADMGFAVDIKIVADDDRNPTEATIRVSGESMHAEFIAKLTACFLAENKEMIVEDVSRLPTFITVKLKRSGEVGREDIYKVVRNNLLKHFGERHVMMQELLHKEVWNSMITSVAEWNDVQKYKYPRLYRF